MNILNIFKKNNLKNKLFYGISKNVFILGLVSLFTDLSSQMVFPLIPLFLTTVLNAGAYAVGIVEGAAETTASLLKVISGHWSDKLKKRKPFVLFGYSLSSITKPLFAFAATWQLVFFIRVIERIGKGIRAAPRDAIVAESSAKNMVGKAYGFHRAMDGLGSILGAVLAFLLLPILGYKNIFLFAFLPGIAAVFIILLVKEKNTPIKDENIDMQIKEKKESNIRLSFRELPKDLKLFTLISSIFALGHFGYAFMLLKAKNIGLADNTAILLYIIFYIVYTVCAMPFGSLSDRVGRKRVLIAGYSMFGIISFGLIFASDLLSILFFFVLYGVFYALIDGAQRAFVADLAPKHLKATALGVFHASIGLVALPGGFIAGLLWDKIDPNATFIYASALSAISVLLYFLNFNLKK